MERPDDYRIRRKHLSGLSDEELRRRFWELTEKVVAPLVELSRLHTSPSVERSVLLRMGFSSLEAGAIVKKAVDLGLLGKGAGHLVLAYAGRAAIEYLEAGRQLAEGQGWDDLQACFRPAPVETGGERR